MVSRHPFKKLCSSVLTGSNTSNAPALTAEGANSATMTAVRAKMHRATPHSDSRDPAVGTPDARERLISVRQRLTHSLLVLGGHGCRHVRKASALPSM